MVDSNSDNPWRVEEELMPTGGRKIYLRAPGSASLGTNLQVLVSRFSEPPFLTEMGWSEESNPLDPQWVGVDGNDLLIELNADHADEIGDYETIEVRIVGSDLVGSVSWMMEPHTRLPKPQIDLSVSTASIEPGQSVTLTWNASNIGTLLADGQWSGEKETAGEETVKLESSGDFEFVLYDPDLGDDARASVFVRVTAPEVVPPKPEKMLPDPPIGGEEPPKATFWDKYRKLIIAAAIILLVILLMIGLWTVLKIDDQPDPPLGGGEDTPRSTEEPPQPEPDPVPPSGPVTLASGDSIERLKQLIRDRQFEDDPAAGLQGARSLLNELLGQGNAEAALIGATASRGPNFLAGLFDERSDGRSLQYMRVACEGGVGARSDLSDWLAQLEQEQARFPSESAREMINVHVPAMLNSCND